MSARQHFMYEGRPFSIPAALTDKFVVRKRWVLDGRTNKSESIDWVYHRFSLNYIWFVIVIGLIWSSPEILRLVIGGKPLVIWDYLKLFTVWTAVTFFSLILLKRAKRIGTEVMCAIVTHSRIGYWAHGSNYSRPKRE